MATNPFFSGRVPQHIHDAVEARRLESGESKTEILIKALAAYLGCPVDARSYSEEQTSQAIEDLQQRVSLLEKQFQSFAVRRSAAQEKDQADKNLNTETVSKFDNELSRQLRTHEVVNLPGLEKMNKNQIVKELQAAEISDSKQASIGPYVCAVGDVSPKSGEQEPLWHVFMKKLEKTQD